MSAVTLPLADTFYLILYSPDFEIKIKSFMTFTSFNIPGSTFSKIRATGHVNGIIRPSYACIS